jgi:serine/threonine-protein kinase
MAALPGGDPLQAAMAAGETPSPAMVAAAGTVGDLGPGKAWACLLATIAGLLLIAFFAGTSTLIGRVNPDKSPDVLTEKAKDILATLGYRERPRDSNSGFILDEDYLAYVADHDPSPRRWDHIAEARPGPIKFIYRQSPRPLVAVQTLLRPLGPSEAGRITRDDPPATTPGMVDVTLDRQGRLLGLRAVPLASDTANAGSVPDWNPLLTAAGLDPGALTPTTPRSTARVPSDTSAAWQGSFRDQPGVVLHIEAAALHGRPVWFDVQGPWLRPERTDLPIPFRVAVWLMVVSSVAIWAVIAVQVRRNLRMGRGDRAGAMRLSVFLLVCSLIGLLLRADHVALAFEELALVTNLMAQALLYAVFTWLMYMALEPIARRRWPQLLVGWSRLLAGRLRDPLVGRDLLVGGVAGVTLVLLLHLSVVVPAWLGTPSPAPRAPVITSLAYVRHLVFYMLWSPYPAVCVAFATLMGLFVNRVIFRIGWLSVAVQPISLYFLFMVFTGAEELWSLPVALFTVLYLGVLLRAGLLPAIISLYFFLVLETTPLTMDWSSWYANRTLASLALLGGIAAYGFYFSLGGKPLFGNALEHEG